MAIVKANYTRQAGRAKASIRYIEHRPGDKGVRLTRTLFDKDGRMTRQQAYALIDQAEKGSNFFRFVISPDPVKEDTERDLLLREITGKTIDTLEERVGKPISWVAAIHADHSPHRHVHIVAVVEGRLQKQDFPALIKAATEASVEQRQELDVARERKEREREQQEAQWELQR
jgi:hypothetical protein